MRILFLLGCCTLPLVAAERDYVRDSIMYRSPDLPMAKVIYSFPDGLLDLWIPALERPEADTKIQAALAIAKAHRQGMKGTTVAIKPVLRELERAGNAAVVRLTMAQTLITLEARDTAPTLFRMLDQEDEQFRNLVEPALAQWDHQPARALWLKRLDESKQFTLVRSIQCLAQVKEAKAIPKLQALVRSTDTVGPVRIEAARSLGTLATSGAESDATALLANTTPQGVPHRVAAAQLLHKHDGAAAVKVLQTLANDGEPAVSAIAIMRLLELDPKWVPDVKAKRTHADPKIRLLAVTALHKQPALEHIPLLSDSTNDQHPDVRVLARQALASYAAKADLRAKVLEVEAALLEQKGDWRGLEQACLLFAELKHQPVAKAMFGILDHARGEVQIASAWAIRSLDVPELLPEAFKFYQARVAKMRNAHRDDRVGPAFIARDYQLSQLIQFLGTHRYKPADKALWPLISPPGGELPPQPFGFEARAAAIWALGMIHEGTAVEEIASQMGIRLSAVNPGDVEDERVRWMCAISLGRMKAKNQLEILERFYGDKQITLNPVNNACGWAIAQVNGTPVPPPGTMEIRSRQWFLVPNK